MKQRRRDVISQSFSVRPDQLEILEDFAALASKEHGARVSMSELLRIIIDTYFKKVLSGETRPTFPNTEQPQQPDE